MELKDLLSLIGGLALFLYGMHMMSVGLEQTAGDKMKSILEKLTSNRFVGVLVGALITAIIQSSSATTVMVVGFVNSGLMTLRQAIWIIMGANIGTTITGQLVALNVGELAPVLAGIGVVMVTFINNKKANSIGEIIGGLGVLFIGMNMMSEAMLPLRESEIFIQLITTISNPFIAVLTGAVFTALIQSSSASVGILQTLANSGLIGLHSSIYIIFGQNIGTCITAFLASLSANRNAKRTTIIHLSFNIIGTVIFMMGIQFIPFVDFMVSLTDYPAAQIANTHTCFNIITTCILLPFGNFLAVIAEKILPITADEKEEELSLKFINAQSLGNAPIAISNLKKEAADMLMLAKENMNASLNLLADSSSSSLEKIKKQEDRIDFINNEVTNYMSKVSLLNMNKQDSDTCNSLYKCFTDIERIGDHAYNIASQKNSNHQGLVNYSIIENEMNVLKDLLNEAFELVLMQSFDEECFERINVIEDKIDQLTDQYRQVQINRLYQSLIVPADCIAYSTILTDIERVSDHIMNIAEEYQRYNYHIVEE